MTTSEPTTGEIVSALRFCTGEDSICGTACPAYLSEAGCRTTIMKNAADRLESQERDLETLRAFHERYAEQTSKKYVVAVCGLTARAEQAEAREKAAIAVIEQNVAWQKELLEKAKEITDSLRGQPQDGEGK